MNEGAAAATTEQAAAATTEQAPAAAAAGAPPVVAAAAAAPAAAEPAAGEAPAPGSAAAAAAATAPVEIKLTLPTNGRLDQADLDAIVADATKAGWTPEEAQSYANDIAASNETRATQLKTELAAHAEVGGAKLDAAIVSFNRALDRFLPVTEPEGVAFRAFLKKTGFEFATPLVLAFSRIGTAMREDGPVGSAAGSAAVKRDAADVLFGDAKK